MNPCEVTAHAQKKKKKKSENVKLKTCRRIQLNPNGHSNCVLCGCIMSPTSGIYCIDLGLINNHKECFNFD